MLCRRPRHARKVLPRRLAPFRLLLRSSARKADPKLGRADVGTGDVHRARRGGRLLLERLVANVEPCSLAAKARFPRDPVLRLSTTRTSSPRASSASTAQAAPG